MKKTEQVYREMLYGAIELKNRRFTQSELSSKLKISLSNIHHALAPLRKMGAIAVNPRNFVVVSPKKALYYWACMRNIGQDIVYSTRVESPVRNIEQNMPSGIIYTAYSGYKLKFKDAPADYSEVYIYADDLKEIRKRFPSSDKLPNLFMLSKDENFKYKQVPAGQLFVDIWNLKEWYAKDFLKAMEARLHGLLE